MSIKIMLGAHNLAQFDSTLLIEPELIPMAVVSRFFQGLQMAHAASRPELSWAFATTLSGAAGRFDSAAAAGPAAIRHGLVIHARGLRGKIRLFLPHHFARRAASARQGRDFPQ